jgi:hypothetical protein
MANLSVELQSTRDAEECLDMTTGRITLFVRIDALRTLRTNSFGRSAIPTGPKPALFGWSTSFEVPCMRLEPERVR